MKLLLDPFLKPNLPDAFRIARTRPIRQPVQRVRNRFLFRKLRDRQLALEFLVELKSLRRVRTLLRHLLCHRDATIVRYGLRVRRRQQHRQHRRSGEYARNGGLVQQSRFLSVCSCFHSA